MKKVILIFSVAVVALMAVYSFSTTDKYPDTVPQDIATKFQSQFIKTIVNSDLNEKLEQNFSNLFDNVTSVDAQFSEDVGYYYIVFGEKNSTQKIEALKIHKEDLDNEDYSYIDFTNIKVSEATQYCHEPIFPSIGCPAGCAYYTEEFCALVRCGVYNPFSQECNIW